MIEDLESRLCLSVSTGTTAGTALSAHELHLIHLNVVARQAAATDATVGTGVTTRTGTALSAHQRHLIHLRVLGQSTFPTTTTGVGSTTTVGTTTFNTGTTLSPHQLHLLHLQHLANVNGTGGLVAPTPVVITTTGSATGINGTTTTGQSTTTGTRIGPDPLVGTGLDAGIIGTTLGTTSLVSTPAGGMTVPIGSTTGTTPTAF